MKRLLLLLAFIVAIGCLGFPQSTCSGPTITIATFNIQSFGKAKMANATIANELSEILSDFDFIAIQEIRDKEGESLPKLAAMLNYSYVVSPRLGSSSSKEQYAFLYDPSIIVFENVSYVLDSSDFERPPFIAKFKAGEFDFFVVDIHVKPESGTTGREIASLRQAINSTEDYIILGDYNAGCSYLAGPLEAVLPGLSIIVPDSADTTVRGSTSCAYDRIAITQQTLEDYAGWGIYRFDSALGLQEGQALAISDHYPVWAEFYISCDTN